MKTLCTRLFLVPVIIALYTCPPVYTQQPTIPEEQQVDTERPAEGMPVVFAGDTIFSVYTPLGEFNPQERATAITQRLRLLARNDSWSLDSMRIVENEGVMDVLLDTLRVFSVTTGDAAVLGKQREKLAEEYRTLVSGVVESRRSELNLQDLLTDLGFIILTILGILLAFWIMRMIFPRIYEKIEQWESRLRPIRFRSVNLISPETLTGILIVIAKGIRLALTLAVLYFGIINLFSLIPWTASWDLRPLLGGLLLAVLVSAAAISLVKATNSFYRLINRKIPGWKGTLIKPVKIKTVQVLSEDRIAEGVEIAFRVLRAGILVVIGYFYVTLVFSFFSFTRTWAAALVSYITTPLSAVFLSVVNYLPNLFFIIVIVAVTYYAIKFVHLIFTEIGRGTFTLPRFHREWADPTYKIVRFMIIAFAAVVIFPYLPGSDSAAFQGVSIFLGVLFSLGSTSAIANVVAGIVITYMRPFRIGDRVKIADTVGDVVEKTLLVTRVRTIKNVDITVPNAMVLGSHIINFSSSAKDLGLILHTGVTIGYDVPWKQVHDLLIGAANTTQHILKDPAPFVLQTSLDDFYVSYELNAVTDQPHIMARIYSELHQNIQDKFNEAGVEIMSPHYSAVRDGNQVTIPQDYLPKSYSAPGFRLFPFGNMFQNRDPKSE